MAINLIVLGWFERLRRAGQLRGGSVLELGPQDLIECPRIAVERCAQRLYTPDVADKLADALFYGDTARVEVAPALYRLFGFERYVANDPFDIRATWKVDLNEPTAPAEQFDAVTNLGTAEHVFDVAAVFRFIHDALKPDGLALHILPVFGDINHGFFNIHPTTYFDLAAANDYVVEHYAYVDNVDVRSALQLQRPEEAFDFDALPIRSDDVMKPDFSRIAVDRYQEIARSYQILVNGQPTAVLPKDYSYVALRKTRDAPFKKPTQDVYAAMARPRTTG